MIKCRLSRLLGDRKMHLLELQRQTGIAYSTLHRLYHEKSTRIDLAVIDILCKALGVKVGDLFEYVEETRPIKDYKLGSHQNK
jgi:putative transcriptional regulator